MQCDSFIADRQTISTLIPPASELIGKCMRRFSTPIATTKALLSSDGFMILHRKVSFNVDVPIRPQRYIHGCRDYFGAASEKTESLPERI
jgi:hypothetical protein